MLAPLPLERLRRELLRRGLPHSYVERVVGEWADHYEDLSSAHFSKEADMPATKVTESFGSETELAEAAVLQFRARTFAGRHPVWTFIVAPVPLLILCWIAYYSSMALVLSTARDSLFDRTSPAAHALVQLCFETSLLLPPVAAALVLARMARRSGRRARWLLTACAIVALIAGCHRANLALPIGGGDGSLMVGFGIGSRQIVWQQAAFPLLIGGAVAWWMSRKPTGSAPAPDGGEQLRHAA